MSLSFAEASAIMARGGCLVYPTETLYAVGADGRDAGAAARIYQFKSRDVDKPLPLILGDVGQLSLVTDLSDPDLERLARAFWPGPLSVLVPALKELPALVHDRRGLTSVRVTPHPLAARLALDCCAPLIATSANISGRPAVADPRLLDLELTSQVDGVLAEKPWPSGGLPSTVVGLEGQGRLTVYRQGAVSLAALRRAGFMPESLSPMV
ncbi:L-threonylcarbamoyladenylate synthase [Desulfovibrio ferrophilus]|uniref:L-threonylcarbamoyladenylate synthase n=1 Tax=Desulfovibrio ferrophilus TaxID=241368 RepID=A0A2Z6AXM7_9BACT|nr:L-threonylcarbamoyladenylate synthase [Desulfovibrio ferrophilus]BBD08007.1 Sua5/YciO/YrdC/YwlC family protein [Desulfovibrio ferrophilus]